MPAHELSIASAGEELRITVGPVPEDAAERLANAEITVLGRMRNASNATFLARSTELMGSPSTSPVVASARSGTSSLASTAARWLPTCSASPLGSESSRPPCCDPTPHSARDRCNGSSMPISPSTTSRSTPSGPISTTSLRAIAVFDAIANNTDRKSGHCLLEIDSGRGGDHVWAIDNGLCFASEDKLRTVIWEFAGEPLSDDLRRAAAQRRRRSGGRWLRSSTTTRSMRSCAGRDASPRPRRSRRSGTATAIPGRWCERAQRANTRPAASASSPDGDGVRGAAPGELV